MKALTKHNYKKLSGLRQCGFTLVELLVTLGISSTLMVAVMSYLSNGASMARDNNIRLETLIEAQAIVQTLTTEIRMAGNGVPFDQNNFQIGESTLSDPTVTEPILIAGATATSITFRINETGEVFLLLANFDPTASLTAFLTEVTQLGVGDSIYMSNSVVSGDEGLYGVIGAVDTVNKTITLNAGYVTTPGATFAAGSVLEEVPQVTYTSAGGGITRNSGLGAVQIGKNSTMTLQYLDYNGNALALPLVLANLIGQLRTLQITVVKTSGRQLSTSQPFSVTVTQKVGIRNFNYYF